jgi:5'-methylthioadenosine phosphorylase
MAKYDMNNLKKYKIGIIGGSGIYDFAELDRKKTIEAKDGPFGMPSGNIQYGILNGVEIYFIPRHGKNHTLSPSDIPYRANIDFLKRLGCNDLVSVSAVGSLKEEFSPGTFILVDQFIDRTFARHKTFFDKNIIAHVSMAEPTCKTTSNLFIKAASNVGIDIINGGTYLAMEGPQFSSLAESKLYRSWGCDVIGMTNMPEAKLAREAEMRYVSIAMVTDYDCWRENDDNVGVEEIIKILANNADKAKSLLRSFISGYKMNRQNQIIDGVDNVLDTAIITSNFSKDDLINSGLDAIASRIINASK